MDEVDSFEQKRRATYLKKNKKEDIMLLYEFGVVDEMLSDTLSNIIWMNGCMYVDHSYKCDTLKDRPGIRDDYRLYFFRDSISGLEQMTLFFKMNQAYPEECYAQIYSRIYLYNKVFSPRTLSSFPKSTDSYFADLIYIEDDIDHQFLTRGDVLDTTHI